MLGSLCSDGPSSFLPKAPKVRASLIPNKWWAQATGKGTYWSNTTTSQCPVYWRASLRARSLASDLQQKRWALLRQLRLPLLGACFLQGNPEEAGALPAARRFLGHHLLVIRYKFIKCLPSVLRPGIKTVKQTDPDPPGTYILVCVTKAQKTPPKPQETKNTKERKNAHLLSASRGPDGTLLT